MKQILLFRSHLAQVVGVCATEVLVALLLGGRIAAAGARPWVVLVRHRSRAVR